MADSNTGENRPPNKGQFKTGDPRINRKGRPKSFDALRELAQQIANEPIISADGQTKMSRVEMVMRSWALSKNYQLQRAFIEIAYGKVPDNGVSLNINLDALTDNQIERIARGEDVYNVLTTSGTG
jgi:hypothetical protein